jgi:hypothetical protein
MAHSRTRRASLNDLLKSLLGSNNVYFQPPPDINMSYPCIVYERDNAALKSADNIPYSVTQRYQVTYIDPTPDSDVIDKLLDLPYSSFSRHFATSGLNHDVFVIYH